LVVESYLVILMFLTPDVSWC